MWTPILAGLFIAVIVSLVFVTSRREARQLARFEQRRAERSDQAPEEFAAECGAGIPSEIADRVRGILAQVSGLSYSLPERTVEPSRLRASDDICADLGYDLDSLSIAHLYTELEREFGIHPVFDPKLLGAKPGTPVTVAHLTRFVVAELEKQRTMPRPDASFRPGFRISTIDCIVLVVGAVGSIVAWQSFWWLGYAIACVVGHFFLFCNVVRMSRGLELAWSGVFLALTGGTVLMEWPDWPVAIGGTFAATAVCVATELRKPSYHGVLWRRINPRLPEWWAEHGRRS